MIIIVIQTETINFFDMVGKLMSESKVHCPHIRLENSNDLWKEMIIASHARSLRLDFS